MDVCNNILYFIYILLVTITISSILICIFKNNENNSRYRSSLFIFYGIVLYHVFYGGKYNGIITSLFLLFIFIYVLYAFSQKKINLMAICRYIRSISIPLLIISICCLGAKLIIHKFNGDSWWINENNISNDISKWGDFATFFGGIFAFISILLAYRAFISQVNASRRTSFDATFTQIFAQHKALHDKAVRHSVIRKISIGSTDIFTICRMVFERVYADSNNGCIMIEEFYQRFNSRINPYIGLYSSIEARDMVSCVSVDLKNYFKYIYHEINIVVSQPDDVLDRDAKRDYIQLIQAQMNYDELICYFINQVEYLTYWRRIRFGNIPNNSQTHAENLRYYRFFHELCRSRSVHVSLVRNVMRNHRFEVLMLIDEDWLS